MLHSVFLFHRLFTVLPRVIKLGFFIITDPGDEPPSPDQATFTCARLSTSWFSDVGCPVSSTTVSTGNNCFSSCSMSIVSEFPGTSCCAISHNRWANISYSDGAGPGSVAISLCSSLTRCVTWKTPRGPVGSCLVMGPELLSSWLSQTRHLSTMSEIGVSGPTLSKCRRRARFSWPIIYRAPVVTSLRRPHQRMLSVVTCLVL